MAENRSNPWKLHCFFSPQRIVELISPYTKMTGRTLLVRSKTMAMFFPPPLNAGDQRGGAPKNTTRVAAHGGGFGYNPRLTHL